MPAGPLAEYFLYLAVAGDKALCLEDTGTLSHEDTKPRRLLELNHQASKNNF